MYNDRRVMTVVGYGQYGIDETIRKQEVKLFPGENSYIYNCGLFNNNRIRI